MVYYIVILISTLGLFFAMSPVLYYHDNVFERFRFSLATTFFFAFSIVVIESVFNLVDIFIGW